MSNTRFLRLIILFSFVSSCFLFVKAQASPSPDEIAKNHLINIKENGVLLVLESDVRKLNALQAIIDNPKASERSKARAKKQYKENLEEREAFNSELVKAMQNDFVFSNIKIIYDYQLRDYSAEPSLAETKPYNMPEDIDRRYRLQVGRASEKYSTGVQAFVFKSPEGTLLKDPFPYYVNLNKDTWISGLIAIFSPKAYRRKGGDLLVDRFNQRLINYSQRVGVAIQNE